jgi:hypothetical protein
MITVQDVKTFLNIADTTNDEFIASCIDISVGELNILTNHRLDSAESCEYYSGNGEDNMLLRNYPPESVTSIKVFNKNGSYTFDDIFEGDDNVSNSIELIEETGCIILKKGYVFIKGALIEIVYTAGYKENGAGIYKTPADLKSVMIQMTAKHFLDSFKGSSLFLKRSTNIGGASSSGTVYRELDLSEIVNKYRRINV